MDENPYQAPRQRGTEPTPGWFRAWLLDYAKYLATVVVVFIALILLAVLLAVLFAPKINPGHKAEFKDPARQLFAWRRYERCGL